MPNESFFEELSAVDDIPALEARTSQELAERLSGIMDTLPGFVIRAANAGEHKAVSDEVCHLLSQLMGTEYIEDSFHEDVAAQNNATFAGKGRLHDDAAEGFLDRVIVHRTRTGLGKVSLANSGHDYKGLDRITQSSLQIVMGLYLQEGYTAPTLMLPQVYTAILAHNDVVVFPAVNKLGPVWHRFDTILDPRSADAYVIKPVST